MPIGVYDVRVVDYGYWRGSPQGSVRAAESRLFRRTTSKTPGMEICKARPSGDSHGLAYFHL